MNLSSQQNRKIVTYGAGWMGCGICIRFALVGLQIAVIDSKSRIEWPVDKEEIEAEIAQTLALLIDLDLLPVGSKALMSERVALFPEVFCP